MSQPQNAIYSGRVGHKRISPRVHAFKYRVFYIFQDLDDFEIKAKATWCLSLNKLNIFSVREKDYGSGKPRGLKSHIMDQLIKAGISTPPSKIFMLTMPRILGYGFNPITVFFGYDANDEVMAVIYEVHNTFGETHSYVFPISSGEKIADHGINKSLYVSPFFEVQGKYRFRTNPPRENFNLLIHYLNDAGELRMTADLSTSRKPLNAKSLMALFFTVPLSTLKVISAIHFEAFRLWLKRVPLAPRPSPPGQSYSIPNSHSNTHKT